ncbi:MAG: ABC transporter ATP-binding protein [Bacteroidales bacterium]
MKPESNQTFTGPVISVDKLIVNYDEFKAVDEISFHVHPGEIFGLLGPNGAGKTSTLECMEGIRQRTSGSIKILGEDPKTNFRQLRNLIGVQLQSSGLPNTMTVEEAIRFFCTYHQVAVDYSLVERFGLTEKRKVQYSSLSAGLQRRLVLALAMVHKPRVIFLDEPTAGLDVHSRVELHQIMNELRGNATSIILATHDMAEAEKMADRVAILLKGRIVSTGTPRALTLSGSELTKIMVNTANNCLGKNQSIFPGVLSSDFGEDYATYFTATPGPTVAALISEIEFRGDTLIDLRVVRPSLEERFLEITQTKNN